MISMPTLKMMCQKDSIHLFIAIILLNKKVIGLMKDKLGGAIMTEFVALRPKLYAFRQLDGMFDKKCKGIKK